MIFALAKHYGCGVRKRQQAADNTRLPLAGQLHFLPAGGQGEALSRLATIEVQPPAAPGTISLTILRNPPVPGAGGLFRRAWCYARRLGIGGAVAGRLTDQFPAEAMASSAGSRPVLEG